MVSRLGVVIEGQSNGVRQLVGYPVAYDQPSPAILAQRTAASKSGFVSAGWDVDQIGDLRPRVVSGTGRSGIEQALGRGLAAWFEPRNIVIVRTCISGADSVDRDPDSAWPTISDNAWSRMESYWESTLAAYDAQFGIFLQVGGEGDANGGAAQARRYPTYMERVHARLQRRFGNAIYLASQIAMPGVWDPEARDIVRAAIANWNDPERMRGTVDTSDLATADGQHWTIDSLGTIGTRAIDKLADMRLRTPEKFGRWAERF